MNIVLLKCRICDYWYRPQAHHYHCPVCASTPIQVSKHRTRCFHLLAARPIEVVRGIPKYYNHNALAIARAISE